jgi:hypothetical protein
MKNDKIIGNSELGIWNSELGTWNLESAGRLPTGVIIRGPICGNPSSIPPFFSNALVFFFHGIQQLQLLYLAL